MTTEKFTVGQEVLMAEPDYQQRYSKREPQRVTITKVARKYVYIQVYGRPVAFDKQTGWESTQYSGSASRLWTQEDWDGRELRAIVVAKLKEHNFGTAHGFGTWDYSTDTLQKVLAVLDADHDGEL